MGRGDKRTAKGKRFKASYGNSRPHKEEVVITPKKEKAEKPVKKEKDKEVTAKKAPPRKAAAKKTEE